MITPADIANIIYAECADFGIERVADGRTITAPLTGERITIHSKAQTPEKYWLKNFVEVNFLVPDLAPLSSEANTPRLQEIQRLAAATFKSRTGTYDDTVYHYETDSISKEEDKALCCHYVNIRLLFKVQNV